MNGEFRIQCIRCTVGGCSVEDRDDSIAGDMVIVKPRRSVHLLVAQDEIRFTTRFIIINLVNK